MGSRIRFVFISFLIFFVLLLSRLFYWQILKGKELSIQARSQRQGGRNIKAPRGNILAKDGSWLAAKTEAWLVYANPTEISGDKREIADKLAPYFVENTEDRQALLNEVDRIIDLLEKKKFVWVPLKHKVTNEAKRNIEAMRIPGIDFEPEETRVYPEASAAAHLLGFVGKNEEGDDIGYFGLEGFYNMTLSGKSGFVEQELDARGIPIMIGDLLEVSAIKGVDLLTHIDRSIQLMLEKKLVEGIERYGAKGGTAIVMNPKNGAILAMSSFPSYDPSEYYEYGNKYFKNPAVSDIFEPGSIFKILIMAAALDSDTVEPDTKCEICEGPLKVDKYTISTWDNEYHKDATMTEIIVYSDNVGMAYVSQKVGADTLYDYLDKFGIGKKTGIDLQGEVNGALRKKGTWNIVDLATVGFGQGVSITPIQMVTAASAIANKGILQAPQTVDRLIGNDWEEDIKPVQVERVISKETAEEIIQMMAEAAKSGEAKWTYKTGFKVAGKTGTAQIPISGHYDEEKTIASFVGFAPYDNPKFTMLVTLHEPQTSPWASETAAPLWYSMAQELFVYMGIQPEN